VLVDGASRGTTPLTLALSADKEHNIVLGKPGYARASKRMQVAAGESTALELKLKAEYGVVFITSRPADATLSVDGKIAGSASRRLRLRTVPHRLQVSKAGYETYSKVVTPAAKLSKKIDVRLKRIDKKPAETTNGLRLTPSGFNLLEFVRDKPVQFAMGASRREQGRRSNETLHTVSLTRAFAIADKEVSNAQYRRFNPRHDSGRAFGVDLNGDEQPVVNVSWDDAARYLNWLSESEGRSPAYREDNGHMKAVQPMNDGYRLPTEAEWVYVARYEGGRRTAKKALKYPWQGVWPPPSGVGNFADSAIAGHLQVTVPGYSDGQIVSAKPAGSAPNAAGIYDLGGNVSEWCHDYYDVYTGGENTVTRDPVGPPSGRSHSVRGASWRHGSITELRLSFRDYGRDGRNDLGIRVARYVRAPTR
jgi:formylglycine-generating enzyme required for sulfatase activity